MDSMEWTRGPTIGRGSTATVSLATSCQSGELFAVKSSELSSSMLLQKEQIFLSKLSCPQIVQYLGFVVNVENNVPIYNLFIEYMPGGSLSDEIKRHKGRLDESKIKNYTHQILQGLEYLHTNGLAHCDLKSHNILIGSKGVKIADLGCAKLVEQVSTSEDSTMSSFVGTPIFMAPEVARGEKQGFEADIWALGCTIIEMATGFSPWKEMNDPISLLYKIGYSNIVPEFPSWLSEKAMDFLSKCLRGKPKERWTAKELLLHPFLEANGSCFDQVKEKRMSSPSTVLEQDLWESLEVLESPQEVVFDGLISISPAERIKLLVGSDFCSVPEVPNWSCDENWLTIRCNQNFGDENNVPSEDDEPTADLIVPVVPLITQQEEVDVLMFDEELSFDNSFEVITNTDVDRHSLIEFYNVEIGYVSKNIEIKCIGKNKTSLFIQCCGRSINPFFFGSKNERKKNHTLMCCRTLIPSCVK